MAYGVCISCRKESDEFLRGGFETSRDARVETLEAEIAKLRHKLELAEAVVAMAKYTVLALELEDSDLKRAIAAYDAATAKPEGEG